MLAKLQDIFASGELSLFVGSALTRAAGLPSWHALAEELLSCTRECDVHPNQIAEIEGLIEHGRLLEALGHLESVLTPDEFGRQMARLLDDSAIDELPALHEAIAALAPRLSAVLTTNLDHLLERAVVGPRIFKLTEEWENCEPLSERRLLFVGWGMQDPGFDAILDRLAVHGAAQHFMLIDQTTLTHARRKQLVGSGLTLIPYENPDGTHAELLHILDRLAENAGLAPRPSKKMSILFASSSSGIVARLRLQHELQIIRAAVGEEVIVDAAAVSTVDELRVALMKRPYRIVHVSGYSERDGLVFEDRVGRREKIDPTALAGLFANKAHPRGSIECVVLDAERSIATGMPTSELVPMTVAIDSGLGGAFEFSRGFYAAVAAGRSLDEAYDAGLRCRRSTASKVSFEARLLRRDKPSPRRALGY